MARIASRGREVIEQGCVTETGITARTKAGELVGLLSDSGAAAMSRPFGRKPCGARRRQVGLPCFHRSAVPAVTLRRCLAPCKTGPGPSSVPGILLPRKTTVKCARYARVLRMAQAPHLTVTFPGKTIGTYRNDGAERGRRPTSVHVKRHPLTATWPREDHRHLSRRRGELRTVAMDPVEIAAIISGCFAVGSVGLTAYVAVKGFRSTRDVTDKTIEAGSQDTIRALNAARADRLWEKRAEAYEETIAYLLYMQHKRGFRSPYHIMGRDLDTATRFWFGDYHPPGSFEIQGRLVAYASDAIVAAYKESVRADNEASFCFSVWRGIYDSLKGRRDLVSSDDDPKQLNAKNKLEDAEKTAEEKDQTLITLIRNE